MGVRHRESGSVLVANLIVHQRIANIFDQTA